jgi:hypothetical protein
MSSAQPRRVRLRAWLVLVGGAVVTVGLCLGVGGVLGLLRPSTPAWAALLGVAAAAVGLAGARERETALGKGAFTAVAASMALFCGLFFGSDLVFDGGGWGGIVVAALIGALAVPGMAVVVAIAHAVDPIYGNYS